MAPAAARCGTWTSSRPRPSPSGPPSYAAGAARPQRRQLVVFDGPCGHQDHRLQDIHRHLATAAKTWPQSASTSGIKVAAEAPPSSRPGSRRRGARHRGHRWRSAGCTFVLPEPLSRMLAAYPTPKRRDRTTALELSADRRERRTGVVGIFPNEAAFIRPVGAIRLEQNDQWAVQSCPPWLPIDPVPTRNRRN
jgi:hypothetical protein